nr:histidine phosphatase family protein [uncultured Neokomagataea sp.]
MNIRFPVVLCRHAAVMGVAGRCYGQSDVCLADGWEQFGDGLSVLVKGSGAEVIHSSPLQRCRLLADYVAQKTGLPFEEDTRLSELNFGAWEGVKWDDVSRAKLDQWASDPLDFAPPGGESGLELIERVQAYWQDVQRSARGVCVITHGGPLRVLGALTRGEVPNLIVPSMPQGSVCVVRASQS